MLMHSIHQLNHFLRNVVLRIRSSGVYERISEHLGAQRNDLIHSIHSSTSIRIKSKLHTNFVKLLHSNEAIKLNPYMDSLVRSFVRCTSCGEKTKSKLWCGATRGQQQQWNHLKIERRVTGTSEIHFVLWCHRPNATTMTINIHFRQQTMHRA